MPRERRRRRRRRPRAQSGAGAAPSPLIEQGGRSEQGDAARARPSVRRSVAATRPWWRPTLPVLVAFSGGLWIGATLSFADSASAVGLLVGVLGLALGGARLLSNRIRESRLRDARARGDAYEASDDDFADDDFADGDFAEGDFSSDDDGDAVSGS